MSWRTIAVLACWASPVATSAQTQTAEELLRQAQNAFQALEFEHAATLYNLVLSPDIGATQAQRDSAQLLLGVSYQYSDRREDAIAAFSSLISSNPCTPAPDAFGASVARAFDRARQSVIAVGLCGFGEQRLTAADSIRLGIAVTRMSLVSVVLQDSGGESIAQMMAELDAGTSVVRWATPLDPSTLSGSPTHYTLLLNARDQYGNAAEQDSVPIQVHASPIDTLAHPRQLGDADLLPETRSMSSAYGDLGKGLVIGAGVAAASMLTYSSLGGEYTKAVAVGGAVSLAGIVALFRGGSNRTISENQRHNENVRLAWEARRDSVVAENRARLADRTLVLTPAGEIR